MTERTMDTPVTAFRNFQLINDLFRPTKEEGDQYQRAYIEVYEGAEVDYTDWMSEMAIEDALTDLFHAGKKAA